MGKGPGFYSDIGKKTKDLLNKDYTYDQKFVITTNTQSGLAFTSTGVKRGEGFAGDVNTSFKNKNVTADVKVDTKSNVSLTIRGTRGSSRGTARGRKGSSRGPVTSYSLFARYPLRYSSRSRSRSPLRSRKASIFATVTVDEFAPGAKSVFTFTIPDHKSGKLELQYKQDYCGITGSIGLTPQPIVEATGALGSEGFSVGGELAFDSASGALIKYNAGIGFVKPDFSASLILAEKGDLLKASYLHTVSPVSRTTVAAEIAHRFSKNENTFTVGGLYELDILTTVKARLNNHGKLAALLQHEWRPKSLITFSGEVDTKSLDKAAKVGLALALKP